MRLGTPAAMTVHPAADMMRLGVCYYPEHWPEDVWADDARRMVAMGLSRVRIGEFAWSRIEPQSGRFDWDWLDRAIETLHAAGLGIILGTPTATPPKWLVDSMPDMLALDRDGRPRGFGSRRHYCFSHDGYRAAAARIVQALAERYGTHPAIVMWQTDNEYGCHDTAVSFSTHAAAAFRQWLAARYGTIAALNAAWGTIFWSMDYAGFDAVELPNLTVTEANPAHWLDFMRFSSDQVVRFNRMQVDILRAHSPGRDITHNFMGFFTQFDHHDVGADCDIAGWDSYPLGFLEQFWFSADDKHRYARQGHPDIAAFHHDLYRGCSGGRWAVLEQQPGPVNWARFNPAPLPGMVRLWTLEALAHGAELVSYFRWRQLPFAQEQMHAGLLRPDSVDDVGAGDVRQASQDIARLGVVGDPLRQVALIFAYDADWVTQIQPQGRGFSALRQCYEAYTALRRCGLNVDIIAPSAALDGYAMVVIPCLPIVPDDLVDRLDDFDGPVVIGPRSGSKTQAFAIPPDLAPGPLRRLIPITITRVESLRDGLVLAGENCAITRWFEHVDTHIGAEWRLADGRGLLYRAETIYYLAGWPDQDGLIALMSDVSVTAGLDPVDLPADLRLRRTDRYVFLFNYGDAPLAVPDDLAGLAASAVIGQGPLPPAGFLVAPRAE